MQLASVVPGGAAARGMAVVDAGNVLRWRLGDDNIGVDPGDLDDIWHFRLSVSRPAASPGAEPITAVDLTAGELVPLAGTDAPEGLGIDREEDAPFFEIHGAWHTTLAVARRLLRAGAIAPTVRACKHGGAAGDRSSGARKDAEPGAPLLAQVAVRVDLLREAHEEQRQALSALYPSLAQRALALQLDVNLAQRRRRAASLAGMVDALRAKLDESQAQLALDRERARAQGQRLAEARRELDAARARAAVARAEDPQPAAEHTARCVRFRQAQLLLGLRSVFVIRVVSDVDGTSTYTINGLRLRAASDVARADDEEHATALGYAARAVCAAAAVLRVRLDYLVLHLGSRSRISAVIGDESAHFLPLYLRGVDPAAVREAEARLRANLAQLLAAVGEPDPSPAHASILGDLERFFVRVRERADAFSAATAPGPRGPKAPPGKEVKSVSPGPGGVLPSGPVR